MTDQQQPTILLVDDEESIRLAMQRWLARRGWNVVTCANGQDAIDRLSEPDAAERYDVILCDLRMPGVSGVHVHDFLLESRPELHARLALATGDVASGEIARFLGTVTCPVLEKPFDFAMLASTLEGLVARNDGEYSSKTPGD